MRICVVVPSAETINQAGVRIRYRRLAPYLADMDTSLTLCPIDDIRTDGTPTDVYVFSKCYDARAQLLARRLAEGGAIIGIDLFDDIFSQSLDSRLTRYRSWLREIGPVLDFAMTSTPHMALIARAIDADLPVLILNDAFDELDEDRLAKRLGDKIEAFRTTGVLKVAWFGIGDNPHFAVGLHDLTAFGGMLSPLRRIPGTVTLEILTNRRALGDEGLQRLRRLPVPFVIAEWSEAAERDLLERSLVSFLPVNAQPFSVAKSLNRAVTALTGGTQVLSAGFPLYERLGDFIYRDPVDLLQDTSAGAPRMRPGTVPALAERLALLGNPAIEAARLANFLSSIAKPRRAAPTGGTIALLHNRQVSGPAHKLVQRLGGLSCASPLSAGNVRFDVRFEPLTRGRLRMILSERAVGLLAEDLRGCVDTLDQVATAIEIDAPPQLCAELALCDPANLPLSAMLERTIAPALRQVLERVFPGTTLLAGDGDPWSSSAATPVRSH